LHNDTLLEKVESQSSSSFDSHQPKPGKPYNLIEVKKWPQCEKLLQADEKLRVRRQLIENNSQNWIKDELKKGLKQMICNFTRKPEMNFGIPKRDNYT
jgi:hypothetical protein